LRFVANAIICCGTGGRHAIFYVGTGGTCSVAFRRWFIADAVVDRFACRRRIDARSQVCIFIKTGGVIVKAIGADAVSIQAREQRVISVFATSGASFRSEIDDVIKARRTFIGRAFVAIAFGGAVFLLRCLWSIRAARGKRQAG
jgi:hypothetical protein